MFRLSTLPWVNFFQGFCGTWDWTQDFTLARQVLYCLSYDSSPFCSGYLVAGRECSHFLLRLAWSMVLLFEASCHHWDDSHILHAQLFSHWGGGPINFFFYLDGTGSAILPISASHVIWDDRHTLPCPAIGWDGSLMNYSPRLA
jgi:hypothetical protein